MTALNEMLDRHNLIWAISLALLHSSCSTYNNESSTHTFRVYEENGVTIAKTTGGPKYAGELFIYERVIQLKEDEREESLLIGGPAPLMDKYSNFYVPNVSLNEAWIAAFNSSGVYQYSFGRKGEGPGEFNRPYITQIGDGFIDVFDTSLQRITRFRTDGTLVEVIRLPPRILPVRLEDCYRTPNDLFVTVRRPRREFGVERAIIQRFVTVYSSDWDTLWSGSTEKWFSGRRLQVGHISWYSSKPFAPKPLVLYSPFWGILITTGTDPTIDIYNLDGTQRLKLQINLPPQPVTKADRDSIEERLRETIRTNRGDQRAQAKASLENLEYPENKAYWGGDIFLYPIQVDESGFIWIRIPPWSEDCGDREKGIRFRVISPKGEYLGVTTRPVHGPGRARLSRGHIILNESDPDSGWPLIVSYRIRPAVEGLMYP